MNLLLDTNVLSVFLKSGDTRAQVYGPLIQGHRLYVSFVTVAELYRWAYAKDWGAKRIQRLKHHIHQCTVVPVSHELCLQWARIQARRQSIGRPISSADAWIAATAIHYELGLVTHNLRDFVELPELVLVTPPDK